MREGREAKQAQRTLERRAKLTEDKLRARHASRSRRARLADERSNAKLIINPGKFNAPVEKWDDDPASCDLKGIDTKKGKSLSEMTREERLERTRRETLRQNTTSKGRVTKEKQTRGKSWAEANKERKMNMGLQEATLMRQSRAHGIELTDQDVIGEMDSNLSYDEQWENYLQNQRDAAFGYAAPEWSYIEKLSPRKKRAFLLKYRRSDLLAMARPHGGRSRMTKHELVTIIIKNKGWKV